MRPRYLWLFPDCCQFFLRLSDALFKETFKGQCCKTTVFCQSLCSSKAGPVCFIQIEAQRKIIAGFPQPWIFSSGYLFPSIIIHVKCAAMDSCSWSRYKHVYLMCYLTWLFQDRPIPWVWEEGKTEMFIWCLPESRLWFTISHSLLPRAEFIRCTDSGAGGHILQQDKLPDRISPWNS